MEQLISIIVPVYKVPDEFLKRCIESIQAQTYKNIEIILIDDGSPDECGKVCDQYARNDIRIKVVHKKNGGLSAARNTGFDIARGEWFMFVDGDDWIEPDMCERMLSIGIKNNVQLVMCGMYKDYPNFSRIYKYNLENNKIYQEEECKELQSLVLDFNGNIACTCTKLINRQFAQEHNIKHDESLRQGAEGIEYNLRLFNYIPRVIFINVPLYHYMYNEESISAKCSEENNCYILKCFEKIKKTIYSIEKNERLIGNYYNRLIYVVITTAISGYFNPNNRMPYPVRVEKYKKYLDNKEIKEALQKADFKGISISRRVTLFLINKEYYILVYIIAYIRRIQIKG